MPHRESEAIQEDIGHSLLHSKSVLHTCCVIPLVIHSPASWSLPETSHVLWHLLAREGGETDANALHLLATTPLSTPCNSHASLNVHFT